MGSPKTKDGKIDHHKAATGDDLKDFVDGKLFPYLKKFKTDATSANTLEYKIGEIFNELKNKIQSGYNLREVINRIDELRFTFHMDFLPQVVGLDSFNDCVKNSSIMVVGDHQVSVLGFDDLLKNKRAVGRTIDQEDIAALEQRKRKLGR